MATLTEQDPDETLPSPFTTMIGGNLNYSSKKELAIDEGIVIGNIAYSKYSPFSGDTENILPCLIGLCALLIYVLAIYVVAKKLMPKCLEKCTASMDIKKFLLALAVGLGLVIGIPVVFGLLALSLVGAIVGGLIALIYALLVLLSIPTVLIMKSELLKTKLFKDKINSYLSLIIVTILFGLITLIPYAGPAIAFLVVITGTGELVFCCKKDCCCEKK